MVCTSGRPIFMFVAALLVTFAVGCTGDQITDLGTDTDEFVDLNSDEHSEINQSEGADILRFTVKEGCARINGDQIGTIAGLSQNPFSFFFVYAGSSNGGLFVVSDKPFAGAVEAGEFRETLLDVTSGSFHLEFESRVALLSDQSRPAWLLHDSTYVAGHGPDGPESPFFGVSSELHDILDL